MLEARGGDLRVGQVQFAQVLDVRQRREVLVADILADEAEVGVDQLGVLGQRHHQRGAELLPDTLSGSQPGDGRLLGVGNGGLLDFRLRQLVGGGLCGGAILGADQHQLLWPVGTLIDPLLDGGNLLLGQGVALGRHDVLVVGGQRDVLVELAFT